MHVHICIDTAAVSNQLLHRVHYSPWFWLCPLMARNFNPFPDPKKGKGRSVLKRPAKSKTKAWKAVPYVRDKQSATFWWFQTMPWWSYFKQIIFCQIGVARSAHVAKEVSCLGLQAKAVWRDAQSTAATIMVATRGSIRTICIPSSWKHVVAATHLSKLKVLWNLLFLLLTRVPNASIHRNHKVIEDRSAWCNSGRLG